MASGKVQLNTGAVLEPLDYSAEKHFDPQGMAKSLSFLCRFAGNVRVFYSVLQHTLLVADIAGAIVQEMRAEKMDKNINYFEVVLMALLHEAMEQVIGDIPGPLKDLPAMYFVKGTEHQRLIELYEFHGLIASPEQLGVVARADKYALSMEADKFMNVGDPVWNGLLSTYSPTKYAQFEITEDSFDFDKWQDRWIIRYAEVVNKIQRIKDGTI